MTQQQLASAVPLTQSQVSGIECGSKGTRPEQIRRIDELLNTGGSLNQKWEELHRDDGYASWARDVVAIESEASEIRMYQPLVIPGLFQTSEYAHALLQLGRPGDTPTELREAVDARIARQELLSAERGPVVKAVIEEHVLRRPLGGRGIMKRQLDAMLQLISSPRVTIQVVPMDSEQHHGMDGAFLLFTVPDRGQVAYTETRVSSDPRDDRVSVENYMTLFSDLCTDALPPAASRALMETIRRQFDDE